jgi:uncharacterized membrane protein YfcA
VAWPIIASPGFYVAAAVSVILLGLSKGGFAGLGMLSLPLMALVVPPLQAASIMLPILVVQDVVSVWAYRRAWSGRNLAILLPAGMLGIALGYLLAARVSNASVELAVGVISIVFGAWRFIMDRGAKVMPSVQPSPLFGLVCGVASGFTSMIAHAGGPPFQIYTMPQRLPRDVFIGTGVLFFATINLIKIPPYLALGQFTAENLATAAMLVPVAIASTIAGVHLARRVSGEKFYPIIYALMVLVGLQLAWTGARTLWGA